MNRRAVLMASSGSTTISSILKVKKDAELKKTSGISSEMSRIATPSFGQFERFRDRSEWRSDQGGLGRFCAPKPKGQNHPTSLSS
jgi:hypothetical protein